MLARLGERRLRAVARGPRSDDQLRVTAQLLEPGKIYDYLIDLWATSYVFQAGHRIRVDVSSSNFPRFDRNLNTGGNNYDEVKGVIAHNAVHHDNEHPSKVTITVVPRSGEAAQGAN